MKQIGLIPSGVQKWNEHLMLAGDNKLVFCSTLAIYIYKLNTYSLERILTGHTSPITSMTQSPHDKQLIATSSIDKTIKIWDIESGQLVKSISTANVVPMDIDWSPDAKYEIIVGMKRGSMRIYDYHTTKFKPVPLSSVGDHDVIGVSYNPQKPDIVFCAMSDSTTLILDVRKRTVLRRFRQTSAKITDFSWDPLSETYILVGYANGEMYLFDTEGKGENFRLHTFEPVKGGISSIAWIISQPGNFVTADHRSGNIRYWNVSQPKPSRVVRVSKSGFCQVAFVGGSDDVKLAQSFTDGAVGVYNMKQQKLEFRTTPGHTETIFDCEYSKHNPDLFATCSYDGNVKIWDTKTLTCVQNLYSKENTVIYSLAWHPTDNTIAGCMGDGQVWIWDATKNRVLKKHNIHKGSTAYKIAWSNKGILACSSKDGNCCVFTESGKVLKKYKHPNTVFGVDFSKVDTNLLATGCYDNVVRVFNIGLSGDTAVKKLRGHTDRVFNVAWHPIFPHVLLSGSNDRTVRVWDTNTGQSKVLVGHENNVRALAWSPEMPHIALSGSWDGTIRVWDTCSERCIAVINDHHADVYGLSVHPQRPFVLGSTSRDTTIRFWSMEGVVKDIVTQSVLQKKLVPLGTPVDIFASTSAKNELCGQASADLNKQLLACTSDVERYKLIFDFFRFPQQNVSMWNLTNVIVNKASHNESDAVVHARSRSHVLESKARELESIRHKKFGGGIGSVPKEEQLAEAASIYLNLGMIKQYCELLFEIGQYERAIAIAPRESMEYWNELSARYAQMLEEDHKLEAVPYYIASNQTNKLIELYESRQELDSASLIALRVAEGAFKEEPVPKATPRTTAYPKKVSSEMRALANKTSLADMKKSQPMRAACAFLAIDDYQQAVRTLVKGDEILQAYALGETLQVQESRDEIHLGIARICIHYQLWDLVISLVQKIQNRDAVLHFLSSITDTALSHSEFTREKLYLKAGFQAPSFYSQEAALLAKDEDTRHTAIMYYALGGKSNDAAELAILEFASLFSAKTWNWNNISRINKSVHWMDLKLVGETSPRQRDLLLAYCYFVAAQESLWKGYYRIVPFLISLTRSLSKPYIPDEQKHFTLDRGYLDYMLCQAYYYVDVAECLNYISQVKSAKAVTGDLVTALDRLEKRCNRFRDAAGSLTAAQIHSVAASSYSNVIIPNASNLPLRSDDGMGKLKSFVTRSDCDAPLVLLERGADAASSKYISRSEALMWHQVCPFSPLANGDKLVFI